MVTKSDLEKAFAAHIEEGRKRLGPPPTADEVEALLEGKLSGAEAARVRELLAYYPELVRLMTEPMPTETAGIVTDEEVAAGIARLRERVRRELLPAEETEAPAIAPVIPMPVRREWRLYAAVAAAAVLVAAGLIGFAYYLVEDSQFIMRGLPMKLRADGQLSGSTRSGTSNQTPHQLSTGTTYLLQPLYQPERAYRRYALELVDLSTNPPRSVWKRSVEQAEDGSFPAPLSTKRLAPGRYELVLYGIDDEPVRLATYTMRLSEP